MPVSVKPGVMPPNRRQQQALENLATGEVIIHVMETDEDGNVREMIIIRLRLSVFPNDFARSFYSLKRLHICNCENLEDISPAVRMQHLQELMIIDCPMLRRLPATLGISSEFFVLHLRQAYIPQGIEMFSKELVLHCWDGEEVPSEIGNLVGVKKLTMNACGKSSLPPSMGNLLCLEEFSVLGDAITKLPKEMGKLDSLNFVFARCPKLTCIPVEILRLPELNVLSFEGCTELCIRLEDLFECSESLEVVIDRDSALKETTRSRFNLIARLNKCGRGLLRKGSAVSPSLWCHVLGRCRNDMDAIFFFLKQKPDLVQETRKRKRN